MSATAKTESSGPGSSSTAIGWKCISYHPTPTELNPTERLWQHTRKNGTHYRFFSGPGVLPATLTRVFTEMQSYMH